MRSLERRVLSFVTLVIFEIGKIEQ